MSYETNYNFANTDPIFRASIAGALVKAAIDINGEGQGEMSVELWQARSQLALNVLRTTDSWITSFAQACKAADYTLTGIEGQDGYLLAAILGAWNDIAYAQAVA